jgi:hypothetical protein
MTIPTCPDCGGALMRERASEGAYIEEPLCLTDRRQRRLASFWACRDCEFCSEEFPRQIPVF